MTFLWPEMLWLLAAVPLVVALYIVLLRRRKKAALRYASLSMVKEAMGVRQSIRRHIPPALFLLALVAMLLAAARPAAVVRLPSQHETIVLAMDVSISMKANDIEPTRFEAMKAAARKFVEEQPRTTRIGVVSFAGTASLVQPPSQNKEEILAAIERFQMQRATAIGSGILVALQAIFPEVEFDLRTQNPRGERTSRGVPLGQKKEPDKALPKPVPPGSYGSAAIILLTDGQTTTGPDPIEAARMAAERGIKVFTVGLGTPNGEILLGEGWSVRVRLDEDTLKSIADLTRAEYFYAGTSLDLKKVYESLNSRFVLEKKETEVTALFTVVAALATLLSGLLSLLWFNRIL